MILKEIFLHNFRNFGDIQFNFHELLTIVVGKNSLGKTNLLESIYLAITGRGFREEKEEELISFNEDELSIKTLFNVNNVKNYFQINLIKKNNLTGKTFFINKTMKKHSFYLKELPGAVLFTPEQIAIINGPPSERRDYFNKLISVYDLEYKKHLNNFENALRKRNKILEKHLPTNILIEELSFWNEYLEKESTYIIDKRERYVNFLNGHKKLDSKEFSVTYLKNEFSKLKLEKVFEKERLIRKTLIGPQKDDFRIIVSSGNFEKDIHRFGSRSEERLAVFWLKINELKYYESLGERPVLLLDDIFSELDHDNQNLVLGLINEYQTVATTSDKSLAKLINLSDDRLYDTINL